MNTTRTDWLNIFLMILAAWIAFNLPFELFLFSYAILGPLHYLTEIGWLHQRNYFATGKMDFWFLLFCSILISAVFLWSHIPSVSSCFTFTDTAAVERFRKSFITLSPVVVFTALATGIAACVFTSIWKKTVMVVLASAVGYYWKQANAFIMLFALLVPTVVHVWLFTGLFMAGGAFKSRQTSGYMALGVFVLCSCSFFFASYKLQYYPVSEYIQNILSSGGFSTVNFAIKDFVLGVEKNIPMNQGLGLKIQRFIAFAYTYHYLNWFSKTNVIRWHQVPKRLLVTTLFIWILSVGLYWYDYKTGTLALFFLSITHVFLEFPLNVRSVTALCEDLWGKIKRDPKKSGKEILFKPKTF